MKIAKNVYKIEICHHTYSQQLTAWILRILLLCIVVALCGCGRKNEQGYEMASFFPIAVGNQWTYKRTVFPENILLIANPDLSTEPRVSPTITSGEETYTVVSQSNNGFVIEGRNGKGKKIFDIFEPGNFFQTETMIWNDMSMPNSNSLVYEEVRTGQIWGKSGTSHTIICYLSPNGSFAKISDPEKRKVTSLRSSALIAVPAGAFHDTLKNTITYVNMLTSQELRTERIFAKGVGCVKETQINSDGKITYQLELTSYKISSDGRR
jgi:hypothetical protein